MREGKAGFTDVDALTELRLDYLIEDNGSLEHSDAETIRNNLPKYFREHLNKDLSVYVIREDDIIVSCAFLLIVMKPMSPAFINGKTATVLNVYMKIPVNSSTWWIAVTGKSGSHTAKSHSGIHPG